MDLGSRQCEHTVLSTNLPACVSIYAVRVSYVKLRLRLVLEAGPRRSVGNSKDGGIRFI
jgi:hypothetical protein